VGGYCARRLSLVVAWWRHPATPLNWVVLQPQPRACVPRPDTDVSLRGLQLSQRSARKRATPLAGHPHERPLWEGADWKTSLIATRKRAQRHFRISGSAFDRMI